MITIASDTNYTQSSQPVLDPVVFPIQNAMLRQTFTLDCMSVWANKFLKASWGIYNALKSAK